MNNAGSLIAALELTPHPEGGWFSEVYRSRDFLLPSALPERYLGSRPYATSIYFLLHAGEVSHFHKLHSDELWHFYDGADMILHLLWPEGRYTRVVLGRDLQKGATFVVAIPRDVWIGAEVASSIGYSLVGCTVAPGFDFLDFEIADREQLTKDFPAQQDIIRTLTTG